MIKKILKWTAWISAVLVLLFVIAYWTSPYWVPGQLTKFLPPSIKLESLELERPGLTRTKVKNLTFKIDGDTYENKDLSSISFSDINYKGEMQSIAIQFSNE